MGQVRNFAGIATSFVTRPAILSSNCHPRFGRLNYINLKQGIWSHGRGIHIEVYSGTPGRRAGSVSLIIFIFPWQVVQVILFRLSFSLVGIKGFRY